MSQNGHRFIDGLCARCRRPFHRRFEAERYCSNACADTGTSTLPAANPSKGKPVAVAVVPTVPFVPQAYYAQRTWLQDPTVQKHERDRDWP